MSRPFRSVTVKQQKDKVYRVTGLRVTASPLANTFAAGVATSALYTATPHHARGSVIALPNDFSQFSPAANPALVKAHSDELNDLAFSPHADNVLATVAKDNTLKVFQLPLSGHMVHSLSTPVISVSDIFGSSLAWHPTVRGLIAVGTKDSITIISADYDTFGTDDFPENPSARTLFKFALPAGASRDIVNLTWNRNGSALSAIGKDGSIYVFDPRTAPFGEPLVSAGHVLGDMKNPLTSHFVGTVEDRRLLVSGLGRARKPCYQMLSIADDFTLTSVMRDELLISSGQLITTYDYDTKLFIVAARSAQSALVFDLAPALVPSPNPAFFQPVISLPFAAGTKGFTLLPKITLDMMDMEVLRVASHDGQGVELYGIHAMRKERIFHPELYPPTMSTNAASDLDTWADGNDVAPVVVQLTPNNSGNVAAITEAVANVSIASTSTVNPNVTVSVVSDASAAAAVTPTAQQTVSASEILNAVNDSDSKVRAQLASKFARTAFLHTAPVEPGSNKDTYSYQLKNPPAMPYGRALTANNSFWALPWPVSGGGGVYIRRTDHVGRVPPTVKLLLTSASILSLALSPLEEDVIAVAPENGTICVYRLPEWSGELNTDIHDPQWTFQVGDMRVNQIMFHPYVQGVLVATGYSVNEGVDKIAIMNVSAGTEGDDQMMILSGLTNTFIVDMDFSTDGTHIAITTKDHRVAIVAIPSGLVRTIITPPQSKDVLVRWLDNDHFLTFGYLRGSERSVSLHKVDWSNTVEVAVVKTITLFNPAVMIPYVDVATGVVVIANVGSSSFNVLHVTPTQEPIIDTLSVFQGKTDVVSSAFIPKVHANVRDVEIFRSYKLSKNNECWPMSWRVPRKRKEFFQDDLYNSGAPTTIVSSSQFFSSALERAVISKAENRPVLAFKSLKPDNMINLSEAPEESLTAGQQKYVQMKLQKQNENSQVGFLGHKSSEESVDYFREKAARMPVNSGRFDARASDVHEDVADDEWDD